MKPKNNSRDGEVRCLNCFTRFVPPPRSEKVPCPSCGIEWRISWVSSTFAKIRGPVWDKYPRMNQ